MKYDVVIPYASSTTLSILGTLRTVHNLKECGRIFIVGERPNLNLNGIIFVEKIPFHYSSDVAINSELNRYEALRYVCMETDVSDEFYYVEDDMLILKYVDSLPYYALPSLRELAEKRKKTDGYGILIDSTIKRYGDIPNYEVHIPILFNRTLLISAMNELSVKEPVLKRSLYCMYTGVQPTYIEHDVKVKTIKDFMRAFTAKETFISTDDNVECTRQYTVCINELPRSKYEYTYEYKTATQ